MIIATGADIIGVNCRFDPERSLEVMKQMQDALKKEGIKMHYMVQPVGSWTPDADSLGLFGLPECPFGKNTICSSSGVPVICCGSQNSANSGISTLRREIGFSAVNQN